MGKALLSALVPVFLVLASGACFARAAAPEAFPLRENGTVPVWLVAGPLPSDPGRAGFRQDFLVASGGEQKAVAAEGDAVGAGPGRPAAWQIGFGEESGALNLLDAFQANREAPGVGYAYCELQTSEAREVTLAFRHNDGCRAWLNHKPVFDNPSPGTLDARENKVRATLQAGANPLLCKVDQIGGEWGLIVAVAGADGKPARGVSATIRAARPVQGRVCSARFSAAPVVFKTPEGERSLLAIDLYTGGVSNAVIKLTSTAWTGEKSKALRDLPMGRKRIEIEVPVLAAPATAEVVVESANERKVFEQVRLPAPKRWTVYLTQHTHTDIGYTRPQTEILSEHLRYIDYALDYCDLTDKFPDDARFRWTCETAWAVKEYVQRRPAAQVRRLAKRLQEGRIEVAGMLLNMSEIADETALTYLLRPLRDLRREVGLEIRTAMQNDVNGAGWCLVDYFHDAGIRYLTMGINKTRSLLPFDLPTAFWWESPSGKRTLAYRSDHYMTANFWKLNDGNFEQFQPPTLAYLKSLEERGYPFDRIGVQFSGYYTDNSPPSTVACELVKKWNETYAWPKLRLSTAREFLEYVEKEHGDKLPVHRQAWPDWWTDGFGSAARETAASREMHTAMQVNETLLAMAALLGAAIQPGTLQRAAAVQEDLLFYDEHTYGAAESIDDPLAENSQVQWGEKAAYVWTAVKNANLLREEALGLLQPFLPRADVPTLAVFNTLSWERSGLVRVFIDHEILPANKEFRILDTSNGESVPAQAMSSRAEGTYWGLWVKAVPSLGYKVLRIEVGQGPRPAPPQEAGPATELENSAYKLSLDPVKGAVRSLIDKATGRDLVDGSTPWGLGQCIYESLPKGRDLVPEAFIRTPWRNLKVTRGAAGPIWKSLQLAADLDGCATNNGVKAEIRLYETDKRVEFHYTFRKLPVASAEAVYVAFPFASPNGGIVYEAQGGAVTPGKDQIPGSASDWQTIQSYLSVKSDGDQIIFGSDAVPLVQLGAFNLGKWMPITQIEKPHVYSWVMNNYWFTNFRVSQEGEFRCNYYLTSGPDTGRTAATRFGWGARAPLVPRVVPAGQVRQAPATLSTLAVKAPNLALVNARPAAAGQSVILHVRELEGHETTVAPDGVACAAEVTGADVVNVLEETVQPEVESVTFRPLDSKFVRLRFQR